MSGHILLFLTLCGWSFFAAAWFKKRFEETIAPALMGSVLALLLFGFVGRLAQGAVVVEVASLLALAAGLPRLCSHGRDTLRSFCSVGFVLFGLYFLAMLALCDGLHLGAWDEFSHWGSASKAIFNSDLLTYKLGNDLHFQDYPAAVNLTHYFFLKVIGGGFHEDTLYFATNILCFSMFLLGFRNQRFRDLGVNALYLAAAIVSPLLFYSSFYKSIYVDPLLGLVFGHALLRIFVDRGYGLLKIFSLGLTLAFLVMLKKSGAGLAVIAMAAILLDIAANRAAAFPKTDGRGRNFLKGAFLAAMLCFPFMMKKFWEIGVALNTDFVSFPVAITARDVFNAFWHGAPAKAPALIAFFLQKFTTEGVALSRGMTVGFASLSCVVFALFCFYAMNCGRDRLLRRRFLAVGATAALGSLVYAASLLVMYLFVFNDYEGPRLASFERYMSTYYLGLLFLTGAAPLLASASGRLRIFVPLVLAVPLLGVDKLIAGFSNFTTSEKCQVASEAAPFAVMDAFIESSSALKGKYQVIAQDCAGLDFWRFRYYLAAEGSICKEHTFWSVGAPTELGPFTKNVPWTVWRDYLLDHGIDFVYLHRSNDIFRQGYHQLFADGPAAIHDLNLYRVKRGPGREASLKQVPMPTLSVGFERLPPLFETDSTCAESRQVADSSGAELEIRLVGTANDAILTLATPDLPFEGRRVRKATFRLRGDASGAGLAVKGEAWNGAAATLLSREIDWKGWRQISLPPGPVLEGGLKKLSFTFQKPKGGEEATLRLDDIDIFTQEKAGATP